MNSYAEHVNLTNLSQFVQIIMLITKIQQQPKILTIGLYWEMQLVYKSW